MAEKTLEPEIMDAIKPFSGVEEQGMAENMLMQGATLQRTQTAYTTAVAVQRPRSITRVANNVLEEAKLAGRSFYYRWPVRNKDGSKSFVQGPSIDLAMCMARNFGNCVLNVEVAGENATHFVLKGYFIDLETGFTSPRLFRQRKSQNLGDRMDKDRGEDIMFQIGQTKAIRNAIIKSMPEWLVDKAIDVAIQSELADIKPENIAFARTKVVDFFKKYGVDQERIEASIGRVADKWTAEDIGDLRGMATALKDGQATVKELFPPIEQTQDKSPEPDNSPPNNGSITEVMSNRAQHEEITALCKELGMDRTKELKEYNGSGFLKDLSFEKARIMINGLKHQIEMENYKTPPEENNEQPTEIPEQNYTESSAKTTTDLFGNESDGWKPPAMFVNRLRGLADKIAMYPRDVVEALRGRFNEYDAAQMGALIDDTMTLNDNDFIKWIRMNLET